MKRQMISIEKLLGGLSPDEFLRDYWQKKPLLIRAAIPDFAGLLTPDELAGLACEEDVQSRLVLQSRGKWRLENGPFDEDRFAELPEKNWTLLVQSLNHHLPEGDALLRAFDFIPYARLDDLMVSYAPHGGGVGPHFDSYDVFLLQGLGKRIWKISGQDDQQLVAGAPLRILQNFETEQEWVLEAGDMLYLPPKYAHWGIAEGDCMTYSIGFRAPSSQELSTQFLDYLQEHMAVSGMYEDADLTPTDHPAEIGQAMLKKVTATLNQIDWQEADVAKFLGAYLSDPKPHIVFDRPKKMKLADFVARISESGLSLHAKTTMLYQQQFIFINGDMVDCDHADVATLCSLANQRILPAGSQISEALLAMLHDWYLTGYIEIGA